MDATSKANSGHPGASMGMAPVSHVLFNKFMNFNPKNPDWVNRDRFVLSYVTFSASNPPSEASPPLPELFPNCELRSNVDDRIGTATVVCCNTLCCTCSATS